MDARLEGQVAIVTGGASGIGRARVHALSALGARVAVVDLVADAADAVVTEVEARGGTARVRGRPRAARRAPRARDAGRRRARAVAHRLDAPGATALTRMPWVPHSTASERVTALMTALMPAFAAESTAKVRASRRARRWTRR